MKNPWLGLLSYQDPSKTTESYQFSGRDEAISTLFAMIDNNLLVTMYGKTGIGKTSVLNAGVFPLLRSRNYLPVNVRLSLYDSKKNRSYAEYIVKSIASEVGGYGGKVDTLYPEVVATDSNATDYLWRYFLTSTFLDKDGQEVYPVISLDQVEEVFIQHPDETSNLLRQIYALLDDSREVPDKEGYSDSTNFRFVLSIREDDLFYLENAIDKNHLAKMKQNRYRLTALEYKDAQKVIFLGKESLEKGLEDKIADRIIAKSKDENGQISTNLLSLLCSQQSVQQNGNITLNAVNDTNKDPLESFYQDCLKYIDPNTREFIEKFLVKQDRRSFADKKDFQNAVGRDFDILTEGQYRIIQDVKAGSHDCVELIHDSLAKTIYHLKTEADERIRFEKLQRHNKWIRWASVIIGAAVIIPLAFMVFELKDDNNRLNNERGYGAPQTISITFHEDSIIATDRELWRATLLVIATDKDGNNDTLRNYRINDEYRDSTLYVTLDTAKTVRFMLLFPPTLSYVDFDETYNIGTLTEKPRVEILVNKNMPPMTEYTSRVVMRMEDREIPLQDAVVIIKDRIQRTGTNGEFTFWLSDSITSKDVVYIVKKGFVCYDRSGIIKSDGKLPPSIELTPTDSLSVYFSMECERMDSLTTGGQVWVYSSVNKNIPHGIPVKFADGHVDSLLFRGMYDGVLPDGKFKMYGYYYFYHEYLIRGQEAYHIFSGWIDDKKNNKDQQNQDRRFEIESHDYVNNRQIITGLRDVHGNLSGNIRNSRDSVATFGKSSSNLLQNKK